MSTTAIATTTNTTAATTIQTQLGSDEVERVERPDRAACAVPPDELGVRSTTSIPRSIFPLALDSSAAAGISGGPILISAEAGAAGFFSGPVIIGPIDAEDDAGFSGFATRSFGPLSDEALPDPLPAAFLRVLLSDLLIEGSVGMPLIVSLRPLATASVGASPAELLRGWLPLSVDFFRVGSTFGNFPDEPPERRDRTLGNEPLPLPRATGNDRCDPASTVAPTLSNQ